jgi:septum formation protein
LKLVLASASPRRAELLKAAGIDFTVRVADIDETPIAGESPADYVVRLAVEKAHTVPRHLNETILAADTTVVLDSQILGKPADSADAVRMLTALSGCKHEVLTGICLLHGDEAFSDLATTAVWFAPLSTKEIADYIASGEPMDKAGAYAIQGLASRFIESIDGSYSNVVGLPVEKVYRIFRRISGQQL